MFFYSSWHAIVGVLHQQLFYSFLITYFLYKHGAFTYHVVGEELQQRRKQLFYSFLITYFLNKHGAFTYHVVGEELQQRQNKPM